MLDENQNIVRLRDEYTSDLVAAIDEGTSSTRFLVFSAKTCEVITYHQENLTILEPKPDWIEMDPMEILNATRDCMEKTCEKLTKLQFDVRKIKTIGVTNQRETTVVWDKRTGKPLYNAIVWCDMRTEELAEKLATKYGGKEALQKRCGLVIHPYFSALKLRWLLDNVPAVSNAAQSGTLMAGTVDTWLIWNLTGGVESGGVYVTDVTNASRTMLMNIRSLKWDAKLLKIFDVSESYLPTIKSSSEIYGYIKLSGASKKFPLNGVPISGCLGDQQAALVGESCFEETSCKNTYGTGCFLLANTGTKPVFSTHGLLTTVAYKFGPDQPTIYALEGSVAVAGQCIMWLRDNLEFFKDYDQCNELLRSAQDNDELYFVPAFSGLYAPYWDAHARGLIIGLTSFTRKAHIIRATFEAVCYQTRDILEAMCKDTGGAQTPSKIKLLADGGMSKNDLFMQMQADLIGATVRRDHLSESTSLGAAFAAGLAAGVQVWTLEQVTAQPPISDDFKPKMNAYERDSKYQKWKEAVSRCKNWHHAGQRNTNTVWSEIIWPLAAPGAALLTGVFVTFCVCKFTILKNN